MSLSTQQIPDGSDHVTAHEMAELAQIFNGHKFLCFV